MADIFLSYSRKNSSIADELVSLLQAEGWSVWYDTHIEAGRRFRSDIEQELDEAKVVLTLWSVDAVQSMWVNAEAEDAVRNTKLVPLRLDQCTIPLTLRAYQAMDFSDWNGDPNGPQWLSLLEDLSRLAGKPKTPAIPPRHDFLVGDGKDATHGTISDALGASYEGAIIGIKAGTYSENLSISQEVVLVGYGKDSGEVIIDGGDGPAATIKNATVRLQSLSLRSSQQVTKGVVEVDASKLKLDSIEIKAEGDATCIRAASRCKLELRDCLLLGGRFGCHAAFQSEVNATRCQSKDQSTHGFLISQGSKLTMHNSKIVHSDGCGILADQLGDVKVRSSMFANHKSAGIEIRGGSAGDIRFCEFVDNDQGIRASRKRTTVDAISNQIRGCTFSCIHVLDGANANIVDNKLTTSKGGIVVFENAEIRASENEITEHEGNGIEVRGGSRARLARNLVSRVSQQGLRCGEESDTESFGDHIALTGHQGVACLNAQLRIEDMIVTEAAWAGIGIFDNALVKLHRVLVDCPSMTGVDVDEGRLDANELTVEDSGDHGIRIKGNSTAQLTMCEIVRSGLSGIRVVSENAISINKCKITAGLDYGIHFLQGSQAEVSSCLISKNLAGICIEEGANPNILSNLIEGNLKEGLRLVGVGGGSVDLTVFRNNSENITSTVPQNESNTRIQDVTDDPLNFVVR